MSVNEDIAEPALPERRSNRPITLAHRLEYALVRGLLGFFRLIGLDAASWISGKFCRYIGPLIKSVHQRGAKNLAAVYPDWSPAQIETTLKDVWENLGRTAAEFAHLDQFDPFTPNTRLRFTNPEKLQSIEDREGPGIFTAGHFANWELMSVAFHKAGFDYGIVYRAANNPLVDELIIQKRGAVMSRRQIPKSKRSSRALVDTLRAGGSLAMLIDQKLNEGIEAPFLGLPAMTGPTAARLALKFGAPITPISIRRLNGAYFELTIRDQIDFTPSGDVETDVLALTTKINQALEVDIRAAPGQWLWFHRRWPKEIV